MIQVGRWYWLDLVSGDKDSVSDVCGLSSWLRQGQWCSVICSTCLVPASTADPSLGSACPSLSISGLEILPCSARDYWPPCCGDNNLPGRLSGRAPLATFLVLDPSRTHEHRGRLRSATSGFPPNSTAPSFVTFVQHAHVTTGSFHGTVPCRVPKTEQGARPCGSGFPTGSGWLAGPDTCP